MRRSIDRSRVPGTLLLRIARLIFEEPVLSAIVRPTIADLQHEVADAGPHRVKRLRARWGGYRAFWRLTFAAPFASWASLPAEAGGVAFPDAVARIAVGSIVLVLVAVAGPLVGAWAAVLFAAAASFALVIHRWHQRHPSELPAPPEPKQRASPQINFSSTEVAGNIGGLIFAIGSVLIVAVGLPSVIWFLFTGVAAGCVLAWALAAWHTSHPRSGRPDNQIVLRSVLVLIGASVVLGARSSAQAPPQLTPPDTLVAKLLQNRYPLSVRSQSQALAGISIKRARPGDPRNMRIRVLPNGDLDASAVPVLLLLRYAYDVPVNPSPRLSGLPGWPETYDIEAKAPANAVPPGLSESEKRGRMQGLIRGLLADRFKLVMRVEQKTMPVYALSTASGGPNLQTSTIAEKDCVFDTGTAESCHNFLMGRGHPLNARAINMDDLAQYIENWTDLPVVNRTAVSGLFAVETEGWTPMRLPPPPPGNPAAARFDDLPTIFTVLRKLGLELKRQEATVPVYTVEHIERPVGE